MNEKAILKMVEPYLSEQRKISSSDFDNVFSMLSQKEKDQVNKLLADNGIKRVDDSELDIETDSINDDFEILYDDDVFASDEIPTLYENSEDNVYEFLTSNKDYKMSNEAMLKMIKQGSEKAKQDFCISNQRLVYKYAYAYTKKYNHKLTIDDLVQAGMIGMLKAIEKFDFNEGTSFSTYAVWWIKQAIVREIFDNGFTIRIPVHMMESINKVHSLDAKYSFIEDADRRIVAISQELEWPLEKVIECLILRNNVIRMASLDTVIGEEEQTFLSDMIVDQKTPSVEEKVSQTVLEEVLEEMLNSLDKREKDVICLRFGLQGHRPHTLEEVGKMFGVTRERIRQIESKALTRISSKKNKNILRDFKE